MLESYIRKKMQEKDILIMTHIVLGYPTFSACFRVIESMVTAGVDLMELQVPFSEPIADGPLIMRANHGALQNGATVRKCLDCAGEAARAFDIPFMLMTYFNIPFTYGVDAFVSAMAEGDIRGAIIPDLPPEEGLEYRKAMREKGLSPIYLFSPTSSIGRMKSIATHAGGFVYCVARAGVTGAGTDFSTQVTGYLQRCREATSLPLAVGFGVKDRKDVDFLKGKADIAVIGTQTIRILEKEGLPALERFVEGLR